MSKNRLFTRVFFEKQLFPVEKRHFLLRGNSFQFGPEGTVLAGRAVDGCVSGCLDLQGPTGLQGSCSAQRLP